MDLKEIIKWFIPCFHRLLNIFTKILDMRLTFLCLFLLFTRCPSSAANVSRPAQANLSLSHNYLDIVHNDTKNVGLMNEGSFLRDQSVVLTGDAQNSIGVLQDGTSAGRMFLPIIPGRTFGRPFKKMLQAMIPLAFQMGAAATWAVIAALVGVKTLAVTLFIVKILLVAGAAKLGALFASKGHQGHQSHGWTPHQKEIHLHIHNGGFQGHGEGPESISPWSREGVQNQAESKHVNVVYDPYAAGPQTISTPYGNYVKIDSGQQTNIQRR